MRNPTRRLRLHSPGRTLPWLMLLLSLAMMSPWATAGAGAQAVQFPSNSVAFSHSVIVIGPNRPAFQTLLARDFPGVSKVEYFNAVERVAISEMAMPRQAFFLTLVLLSLSA
ncbi:MAG: hypothetical protein ACRD2B_12315, partial [Terriglobia bacterium]